tara:strand:- start:1865 stop:2101 length:237 start_codon:yes stop_codon:yes gene_type:complete
MDPYYFLDTLESSDEDVDLSEFCECYPNGDWELSSEDDTIIYKNKSYQSVNYDNTQKKIYFKNNNQVKLVLELLIRET